MSFSLVRSVSAAAVRLFPASRRLPGRLCAELRATGWQTQHHGIHGHGFTRSLWHLSRKTNSVNSSRPQGFGRVCGCSQLHTKGDQELVEFLKDEIKFEKESEKNHGKLPRVKDFDVQTDGAEVYLTKTIDGETIKVTLNVNNSVDDESLDYEESGTEKDPPAPQMVAKPPFMVEINKGMDEKLVIHCSFPPPEEMQTDTGDAYIDLIQIDEVSMLKGDKLDDKVYAVSGTIMDGNLYDLLLSMLEERGIDGDFIDQLVDFSTSFEHKRYVEFLEKLQQFSAHK